jgi:DNA-binding CsgD family transcriptional regulator
LKPDANQAPGSDLREFSEIVGHIYDVTLNPKNWPALLERITDYMRGERGLLQTPTLTAEQGRLAFSHRIDESILQSYADHFIKVDPWIPAMLTRNGSKDGGVIFGDDVVPTPVLMEGEFYRDFLRLTDVVHNCVGLIFGPESQYGPLTTVSVFRGLQGKPYEAEDRERMALIMPHLSRAIGMQYRLLDTELRLAASLSALDRLNFGVFLIGAEGNVVHRNAAAEAILSEGDALKLNYSSGRNEVLTAIDPHDASVLADALSAVLRGDPRKARHFSDAVNVKRAEGRGHYSLQLSPLPLGHHFNVDQRQTAAIVFVMDFVSNSFPDPALLAKLYRLTPAESRLSIALAGGETLANYSAGQGIAYNTARAQLRAIFDKTGTSRQAELVKLIMSLSAKSKVM